MKHQQYTNHLHSRTSWMLVAAVCACVPEGAESIDQLRDLDMSEDPVMEEADELPVQFAGPALTDRNGSNIAGPATNSLETDFNGDGYADLVVGVPGEVINGVTTGAINVIYGTAHGLDEDGDQFLHRGSPGIDGEPMDDDEFGRALAAGDFNGDGYADLAIGAPAFDRGGFVHVLYGTSHGLDEDGDQLWSQDTPGIDGIAEPGEEFGRSLTTGDFDDDGYADLAIGVPLDDGVGAVNVIYGSADGLDADGDQRWTQDSAGVLGIAEHFDVFGSSLAAGDLDGDGRDDLAIGVPGEDLDRTIDAGQVNVLYGSSSGLTADDNQVWHQNTWGIDGLAEAYDSFGEALAIGDFDDDGYGDLAVGVPFESLNLTYDAGAINVIYGTSDGLDEADDQFLHQDSPGIEGVAEQEDRFGEALAAGNFDGDDEDDLAIGAPFESLGSIDYPGAVNVLYGSPSGLDDDGDQFWHQNTPGIDGVAGDDEFFGWAVAAGDFDGDGRADLSIGVPYQPGSAGAVNVIYGKSSGLDEDDDQVWHQNSPGIEGVAEANDNFGLAVR